MLVCLLALTYLVSALVNGLTLTTLGETASWFAVAAFACATWGLTQSGRLWVINALCWFGAALSLVAPFVFVQLIDWPYGVGLGRLQFPFQYANAAGAWFGAIAFLCLLARKRRLRGLFPLPVFALLLTKSGGTVVVFGLLLLVLGVRVFVSRRWPAITGALLQLTVAAVAFVEVDANATGWGAAMAALILGMAWWAWVSLLRKGTHAVWVLKTRSACLAFLVLVAVGCVGVGALYGARISEALGHFVARWVYVVDAASVVNWEPLLGIGPDNWRYVYPRFASAQYAVNVVHCSYAQVACDAGLTGLGLLVAAAVVGCVGLVRFRDLRCLVAASMVLLHSLVDFDLQFGAIAALLVLLLCDGRSFRVHLRRPWRGVPYGIAIMLLIGCLAGVFTGFVRSSLDVAQQRGDVALAGRLYGGNLLALGDISAHASYLKTLQAAGHAADVVADYEARGLSTFEEALPVVLSMAQVGQFDRGFALLLRLAELEPYNVAVFSALEAYWEGLAVDDGYLDRYISAVEYSNALVDQGNAALLDDQVTFKVPECP